MTPRLESGHLMLDLYELLTALPTGDRVRIVDALACQDEVINEVMNQVIDGWTTEGSHAGTSFGGNPDAVYGIDGARMRIAKASSEIAATEIRRLAEELERVKARMDEGWKAYHEQIGLSRKYGQ